MSCEQVEGVVSVHHGTPSGAQVDQQTAPSIGVAQCYLLRGRRHCIHVQCGDRLQFRFCTLQPLGGDDRHDMPCTLSGAPPPTQEKGRMDSLCEEGTVQGALFHSWWPLSRHATECPIHNLLPTEACLVMKSKRMALDVSYGI